MADNTKIEWTDATWNPITGCSLASPGCTNCYAMLLAGTRLSTHKSREGLTRLSGGRPKWTGEVRFNEDWLDEPLRWKRPRRVFVCAHGDLFHENIPDEWIDRVFAVMALAPQHTFQVLTKRAARMREYLTNFDWARVVESCRNEYRSSIVARHSINTLMRHFRLCEPFSYDRDASAYPLPNVWLGVSVEDRARRDRIVDLAQTPAAVRWVSAEPLLDGVTLTDIPLSEGPDEHGVEWLFNALTGEQYFRGDDGFSYNGDGPAMEPIDWLVVGGESGPGARPMHPSWAIDLRDQCVGTDVRFFFKQWGDWAPVSVLDDDAMEALYHPRPVTKPMASRRCRVDQLVMQASGRQFPIDKWSRLQGERPAMGDFAFAAGSGAMTFMRCGKKVAGRLLSGREWNEVPA
jgi:protein gp37